MCLSFICLLLSLFVSVYLSFFTCLLLPVSFYLSPFTCLLSPVSFHLSPFTCLLLSVCREELLEEQCARKRLECGVFAAANQKYLNTEGRNALLLAETQKMQQTADVLKARLAAVRIIYIYIVVYAAS